MNPQWFGDSYDIVKRFFCEQLASLGYAMYVDPMLTGDWNGVEADFYRFLGVRHEQERQQPLERSALLIDPDTGISKPSRRHVTLARILQLLETYEVVFVFDQSFSRNGKAEEQIQTKLSELQSLGAYGFYYDSHAKFLFASRDEEQIQAIQEHLLACGIPRTRLRGL